MTQNNDKPKLIYGGTMTAGIELAYCETGRHAGWVFAKDYYGQWVTLFKIPDHHSLTPPTSPNLAVLEALIDQIEVFKQRIHQSIISKPQAITIETYDLLDYIVTSLEAAMQAPASDRWMPIGTCPKEHGVDYRLWDETDKEERVTWYGRGEWCHEGNYTHWQYLTTPILKQSTAKDTPHDTK